jgi:hypothetical protein
MKIFCENNIEFVKKNIAKYLEDPDILQNEHIYPQKYTYTYHNTPSLYILFRHRIVSSSCRFSGFRTNTSRFIPKSLSRKGSGHDVRISVSALAPSKFSGAPGFPPVPAKFSKTPSRLTETPSALFGAPARSYSEAEKLHAAVARFYSTTAWFHSAVVTLHSEEARFYAAEVKLHAAEAKFYSAAAGFYAAAARFHSAAEKP